MAKVELSKFSLKSHRILIFGLINGHNGASERRIEARCLTRRKGRIVRGWINYLGAAAGHEVPLTVTARKNLNPGGVLPVALGVPVLAGAALFGPVFARRRNVAE
jgi:hypothetical protein